MDLWQEQMDAGSSAFSFGRYEEAESCFLRALESAEKNGTVTYELFQVLNDLALLYSLQLSKDAEARLYYERFKQVKQALKISEFPTESHLNSEVVEKLTSNWSERKFVQYASILRELGIDLKFKSQGEAKETRPRVLARFRKPSAQEKPKDDSES